MYSFQHGLFHQDEVSEAETTEDTQLIGATNSMQF